MSWDWCSRCGGEMVSCDCEEVVESDDVECDDDYEEIDDRRVVAEVNGDGAIRIVVM